MLTLSMIYTIGSLATAYWLYRPNLDWADRLFLVLASLFFPITVVLEICAQVYALTQQWRRG